MFYEIRQTMIDIIKQCYSHLSENKINQYTKFYLKLESKTVRTFLGKYVYKDRSIHLYNVKTESNVSSLVTLIHELAHHIDYCNRNYSNHDEQFYKIHLDLLKTAFDMHVIDYTEFMLHQSTAGNVRKLKRLVEKMNYPAISSPCDYKKDYIWIMIKADRNENEKLKLAGFFYNRYICKWCIRCQKSQKDQICSQFNGNDFNYADGSTLVFYLENDNENINNTLEADQNSNEKCPKCGRPLVIRNGKYGTFRGCSGFPECKYIKPVKTSETEEKCPLCGKLLTVRSGKYGKFLACTGYPDCKYTRKADKK